MAIPSPVPNTNISLQYAVLGLLAAMYGPVAGGLDVYKRQEFSCAITAASATVGPIFPPSIPMVIYAMLSGASIGKLFMGCLLYTSRCV